MMPMEKGKVGEVKLISGDPFQKLSDLFGSRLLQQAFEPDIRINKVHSQSPRHSSAFFCNCSDVY
jgi:hypothetical protein